MPEINTNRCPYCQEDIAVGAKKCKHCGEVLDETLKEVRQLSALTQSGATLLNNTPVRKWSPGIAALLSLVIPGAGQMYKGNIGKGICWLVLVSLGYFLFLLPGIALHIVCIVSASKGNPYVSEENIEY